MAPEHGAQPRKKLFGMKRLRKIIVRSKIEPAHAIAHVVAGRKQDGRGLISAGAHLSQNGKTIPTRQHNIEHNRIDRL